MYNPQLDTFVRVAEAGSFSKAAAAMFISPTAVIKQMNLLEARLGVTLFRRTNHGLTLTRAGESLLADARHVIQYCNESVARARTIEEGERRVIRVGVSLMTPASHLARLWPDVQRLCPSLGMRVVSFENSPQAPQQLGELGRDIDVIAGVFDDGMLELRGCAGLPLLTEPLCCAVPLGDSLAARDVIGLEDLHGRALMVIHQGWNERIDALRDELAANHPEVTVVDFDQYRPDAFNRCATEGLAMVTLPLWDSVNPMLVTRPTSWGFELTYGIMHAREPSPQVREFLDAVAAIGGGGQGKTA